MRLLHYALKEFLHNAVIPISACALFEFFQYINGAVTALTLFIS